MKQISQIISAIFSPLLVPTYAVAIALWTTMLAFVAVGVRVNVTLITFLITAAIPALGIFILYKMKLIGSTGLNERTDRTYPYIITAMTYIACMIYLMRANAPSWLWLFMAGGLLATVVSAIVNRWWKISAHLAAMGGLVAMTFIIGERGLQMPGVNTLLMLSLVVLASGMVGTARVYLRRHTLAQVLCGFANGFLCVYLLSLLS